jgi:hypothetical protein
MVLVGRRDAGRPSWKIGRRGVPSVHPRGERFLSDSRAVVDLENKSIQGHLFVMTLVFLKRFYLFEKYDTIT